MENLFVNDFSSRVCDVILQKQKDRHDNAIHQQKDRHDNLFIVLYYASSLLMKNKVFKHNAWSYLLLHIKLG